jgi:hypothetical protein
MRSCGLVLPKWTWLEKKPSGLLAVRKALAVIEDFRLSPSRKSPIVNDRGRTAEGLGMAIDRHP